MPGIHVLLHVLLIVEERRHGTQVVAVLLHEAVVGTLRFKVMTLADQLPVGVVHVPHVVLRRIMSDVELGVHEKQLLEGILHGEDAADDDGALGIDVGLALKDFRETLKHAACYLLVLLCP